MKIILSFLCSIFALQQCEAQKAVVANLKENVVYVGIPNPLGILAEGYKWDEIDVSTDNGRIEKQEEPTGYFFYPKNVGKANILLKSKNGDTLGSAIFRIKYIPNPTPKLGNKSEGKIKKKHLLVIPGIYCQLDNFDFDCRFVILTYDVLLFRNDRLLFNGHNLPGPFFTEELKNEFKKTNQDDKLIFYGITAQGPDKRILELSPMEFTIIE